jgi:hypothetical protein
MCFCIKKRLNTAALLLIAATAPAAFAKEDPDLLRPERTTGGQIGIGAGLVAGTIYGGPEGGIAAAAIGGLIGHGTDRLITRTSNDLTGPAWKKVEAKFGDKLKSPLPKKFRK